VPVGSGAKRMGHLGFEIDIAYIANSIAEREVPLRVNTIYGY